MIAMPGAEYALINENGIASARLDAFFIDRFEVTNGSYRSCIDAGKCSWPLSTSSSTRNDYFTNPAFDEYPVIEVTQAMAEEYCSWKDKRLPSAAEWQAAASVSPTTGQAFAFPWGKSFDPQRANSAESGYGDTVVIGLFRPGGDSPSGAVDMAGNVAEWTALSTSIPATTTTGMKMAAIKGGSYRSGPDALNVGAQVTVDANQAWPDVGFRCAKAQLLTQS
jgi:formylglycine-generating enzyme required for sulfatase activity